MAQQEYMAGMLRLLILNELSRGEGYGYGIAKGIVERSGGDLTVRPESLYPVLHRMEQEGLLSCQWIEADNGRPRKVYTLTKKGRGRWEKGRAQFTKQAQGALKAIGADPRSSMLGS